MILNKRGEMFGMFTQLHVPLDTSLKITELMRDMTDSEKDKRAEEVVNIAKSCKTHEELLEKLQEKGMALRTL